MKLGDPVKKFEAFGWNAQLVTGTDVIGIQKAINSAVTCHSKKPVMIVLKTVKGQGAKCIMEMPNNHCIALTDELKEKVMSELDEQAEKLEMEVV